MDFLIQTLSLAQIRRLYRERICADFPPDERKPLWAIERALARDEYICFGAVDGARTQAYAFFVKMEDAAGTVALFDYYAVEASCRGQGIGSRFLQALIAGPLKHMACVLLEVDDPDFADSPEELDRRNRRLSFYLRNGLKLTPVRATVYHVEYRILALPVGVTPSTEETARVYAALYRAIMPRWVYARMVEIRG